MRQSNKRQHDISEYRMYPGIQRDTCHPQTSGSCPGNSMQIPERYRHNGLEEHQLYRASRFKAIRQENSGLFSALFNSNSNEYPDSGSQQKNIRCIERIMAALPFTMLCLQIEPDSGALLKQDRPPVTTLIAFRLSIARVDRMQDFIPAWHDRVSTRAGRDPEAG